MSAAPRNRRTRRFELAAESAVVVGPARVHREPRCLQPLFMWPPVLLV